MTQLRYLLAHCLQVYEGFQESVFLVYNPPPSMTDKTARRTFNNYILQQYVKLKLPSSFLPARCFEFFDLVPSMIKVNILLAG